MIFLKAGPTGALFWLGMAAQTYLESSLVKSLPLGKIRMPKWMQASRLLLGKSSKQFVLFSLLPQTNKP